MKQNTFTVDKFAREAISEQDSCWTHEHMFFQLNKYLVNQLRFLFYHFGFLVSWMMNGKNLNILILLENLNVEYSQETKQHNTFNYFYSRLKSDSFCLVVIFVIMNNFVAIKILEESFQKQGHKYLWYFA